MPLTLAVAGMVGSGKSTLTRALAHRFGLEMALESVGEDNPWLPLFYDDGAEQAMRDYALPLQLHFLATRFAALRQMRASGGSWILDRTWYEDAEVFARGLFERGLMAPLEHELYMRLYGELLHSPAARPPRLLVYLHGPIDVILERIRRRGRDKERDTPDEYWHQLHARYERWVAGFRACPVLRLDVREYDLLRDPRAAEEVAARVRGRLERELPQTELWDHLTRRPPTGSFPTIPEPRLA